jgi:tetratricopeptide (TPR) repeat protein
MIPEALVLDFHLEKDGEFEPRTEEEKEKFAKGLVPWAGSWVSKAYRDKKRQEALENRRRALVEQQKERQEWRNHVTVTTRKFVFKHTLPDDVFEELKVLFEAYYDFFSDYWGVRAGAKFGKPVIHIYHNEDYFLQRSGAPKGVVGWYMPLTKELHFFYDRDRHRFTIDVMFHEGNHMLTHMIDEKVRYPKWLNEGMAEYFGASRWDPAKKEMTVGHLQSARLAVIEDEIDDGTWRELEPLMRAPQISATEYAWVWSFCHFLLSSERYQKGFKKFYLALARSSSVQKTTVMLAYKVIEPDEVIEALKRYLRIKDLKELEQEWHAYIKDNLVERPEGLDYGMAAWIMELYGRDDKAKRLFRKALAKGSDEAWVHYGYAELRAHEKRRLALKHATRATELDPLHARAWALRGRCLLAEDEEEGLRMLRLGEELDPMDGIIRMWVDVAVEEAKQNAGKPKPPEEEEEEEGCGE